MKWGDASRRSPEAPVRHRRHLVSHRSASVDDRKALIHRRKPSVDSRKVPVNRRKAAVFRRNSFVHRRTPAVFRRKPSVDADNALVHRPKASVNHDNTPCHRRRTACHARQALFLVCSPSCPRGRAHFHDGRAPCDDGQASYDDGRALCERRRPLVVPAGSRLCAQEQAGRTVRPKAAFAIKARSRSSSRRRKGAPRHTSRVGDQTLPTAGPFGAAKRAVHRSACRGDTQFAVQ